MMKELLEILEAEAESIRDALQGGVFEEFDERKQREIYNGLNSAIDKIRNFGYTASFSSTEKRAMRHAMQDIGAMHREGELSKQEQDDAGIAFEQAKLIGLETSSLPLRSKIRTDGKKAGTIRDFEMLTLSVMPPKTPLTLIQIARRAGLGHDEARTILGGLVRRGRITTDATGGYIK